MYPATLPVSEEQYFYTEQDVFQNEYDLVRGYHGINYEIDMHVQGFWEVNIITRGRGMHYVEDRRIEVERGDVFIIPAGMRHGYAGGNVRIGHNLNPEGAKVLERIILAEYPNAHIEIEQSMGLCLFYAEEGGLMVGYEDQGA